MTQKRTQPVVDPRMLRLLGFEDLHVGQRIAHGLYTASLISAVLGTRLPGPGAVYRSQTLNFHGPVKIGDVVEVVVEVVELTPKGRIVGLHCEARVDGRLVLDG